LKKNLTIVTAFIFIILPIAANAGLNLRTANWNFGDHAWLDFTSGTPVSKSGSALSTWDGCSGASDKDGNLLFYTDGMTVYNRNHKAMPNGKGMLGHISSSQSGFILPVPESDTKYYILSVNAMDNFTGLNYSVMDMELDGGLGNIISGEKNKNLADKTCEKVTAVQHSNGVDYWVITHLWGENTLVVYRADKDGITFSHKQATTVMPHFHTPGFTKGYAKVSPNGKFLALSSCGIGVHLYDFDRTTGQISNERAWLTNNYQHASSVEFSPNSRFLYSVSPGYARDITNTSDGTYVMQIEIATGKEEVIYRHLGRDENTLLLGCQLALDGVIYIAQTKGEGKYLAAITKPDEAGSACGFELDYLFLEHGRVWGGLPQYIHSFYSFDGGNVIFDECEGGEIHLEADEVEGYSYQWTGPNDFSTNKANYTISPSNRNHSGTYTLTATAPDGTVTTEKFEVEIKYVDIEISTVNIDIKEGQKSTDYFFTIKNNSPYDVEITDAELEKGKEFKLNSINFPITIPAGGSSTNDISCYLFSNAAGSFSDKLILEVSEPCPAEIESETIHGEAKPLKTKIIYVHFPDTIAHVSEFMTIPLKARLSENAPEGTKFDLKLTWHYLADVYFTAAYQKFDSEINYNLDSLYINEFVTGKFYDLELDTTYRKIADISGFALLNSLTYTPLTFDVEEPWSTDNQYEYIIVGEHGSITSQKPPCASSDISINYDIAHAAVPSITPMDESAYINAFSPDDGKLTLRIFNLTGELIEEFNFDNIGKFNQQINLDMPIYANGVYFLAWTSKTKTYRQAIIIQK
jgi:hypothetical protein